MVLKCGTIFSMGRGKHLGIFASGRNRGFSMVAALVAFGMMGGLALLLANLTQQQQVVQKTIETEFEINSLYNFMRRTLYDPTACFTTLGVLQPIVDGRSINAIRNKNAVDVVRVGREYGNKLIKVESMTLRNVRIAGNVGETNRLGEVDLEVVLVKQSKAIKGYDKVSKMIPLSIKISPLAVLNNGLAGCRHAAEDIADIISEAMTVRANTLIDGKVESTRQQLCVGLGGVYDVSAKSCSFPGPPVPQEPNLPDLDYIMDRVFQPVGVSMGTSDCSGYQYICVENQTAIQATNCPLEPASSYPIANEDTSRACYRRDDDNNPSRIYVSDISCRDAEDGARALADPGNLATTFSSVEPANNFQGTLVCGGCYLVNRYRYAVRCRLNPRGYVMRCHYQCL